MLKVHILTKCEHCKGQAYLPTGEVVDNNGKPYTRYIPCPNCEGSGNQARWVSLQEFAVLLEQAKCSHEHIVMQGGMHFNAGDVWDDMTEVCSDCDANLDER